MGVVPILQVGNAKLQKEAIKNVSIHSVGAKYDYKNEDSIEWGLLWME